MKRPIARPTSESTPSEQMPIRAPRVFSPAAAEIAEPSFDQGADPAETALAPRRRNWLAQLAWTSGGILVSAGLGLTADRLIRDLFATNPWLGWAGLVALGIFVAALGALIAREAFALRRLRQLDDLRTEAARALAEDNQHRAQRVAEALSTIYTARADLARARQSLADHLPHMFDGKDIVALTERSLMAPLDARAKALTAASARRVALVTAVSPRALVDIAFVIYESVRLAGAIAALYGARPGLFGFWRLLGAVLAHLAVTGGLVLTDGIVEQLVGQGLASRVSQRLGEGVVNGLMTVRVGIAAARVVRPLPYETQSKPLVRDFVPELVKVTGDAGKQA